MALPPTIPTSFVPKQPVTAPRRRTSGANPFLALSYFIVGVSLLGCLAIFGYKYYLDGVVKKKANDVVVAQNKIDQATVTEFIRLRDRFTSAKTILNQHVGLSQFFNVLETITLQSVHFSSLKVTVTGDRRALIEMTGTARSFNALAAQSAAFASEKRIKRAIFSGITVQGKDNLVAFNLTAELDPSLVVLSTAPKSVQVPPQTPVAPPQTQATGTPPTPTRAGTGTTTPPGRAGTGTSAPPRLSL